MVGYALELYYPFITPFLSHYPFTVLLIKKNAAVTSDVATTQAVRAKHERPFDKGELARLIHHVIAAADQSPENFDDEDDGKKPKLLKAAREISFSRFYGFVVQ